MLLVGLQSTRSLSVAIGRQRACQLCQTNSGSCKSNTVFTLYLEEARWGGEVVGRRLHVDSHMLGPHRLQSCTRSQSSN